MATQIQVANLLEANQEPAGEPRYVARQPILDLHGKAHGNELHFWNGHEPVAQTDSDQAARSMLDKTLLFGLDHLSCGLPAFVRCTADLLIAEWVQLLPPHLTVLELPAASEPTPSLLAVCGKLKEQGFRLALADFAGQPESGALVELADYIKIDLVAVNAAERQKLLKQLRGSATYLVATHVETQGEYGQASSEGFDLFQGFYFCRPQPVESHRIPGNRLIHVEILDDLQNDPIDLHRMSQLVMCDASLTYRLLRLVNSPICAMRQQVTSIQEALMLVGDATFRRIAMLAIASDFNSEQPSEILRMAFVRGRFCEQAASLCGLNPSEQYLIGMVSLFPAMLRIVIEDLVRLLPLRPEACSALLAKGNPEGVLLQWGLCQEHGDWAGCEALAHAHGLDREKLIQRHAEAVEWADAALNSNA